MATPRTIAVVTGTRAEYGLLEPVLQAIENRATLKLRLIVAGAHLTSGSLRDIRFRYRPSDQVRMDTGSGTRREYAEAVGQGISLFTRLFDKPEPRPEFVLVLGDRIEAFAATTAASLSGLRVAHMHGGDRAEGVSDEAMRHAMSKLAHLHLPATAQSKERLLRMGENPECVHVVGSPAADGLADVMPAADAPEVIVLQHPVGDHEPIERERMLGTLEATDHYDRLVFQPNHDPGFGGIVAAIRAKKPRTASHVPRKRFLELIKGARLIVGNSSAGLIEAAILGTPCVNIGPRQAGRERCENVIDCDYGRQSVADAVSTAESLDRQTFRHPYGKGDTGSRVADLLATVNLKQLPVRKQNAY